MDFRSRIMAFLWTATKDLEVIDHEIWIETLFINQLDL